MLDYLWDATLFFIVSAAGMWAWVICRRALKTRRGRRNLSGKAAGASWLLWSETGNLAQLDAELAALDPRTRLETASRILLLAADAEREFILSALIRSGFDKHIEHYFRRADEGQRLLCCEILGSMTGSRSFRILRKALKDRAPAVRIGAAISLARRGELPPIAEALRKLGPAARGSARLARLFEELLPGRRREIVDLAASPACEPQVRISALQALANNWDPGLIGLLEAIVEGAPPPVAAASARLIGELAEPSGIGILLRLLESDSAIVRRAAAESAGRIGDAPSADALAALIDDEDDLVRHSAARALHQICASGAPVSVPAIHSRNPSPAESSPQEAA
jgi:hypothetical protein